MDWKEAVNWLISPLPNIFKTNTKGEPVQDLSLADKMQKGWKYLKVAFWSVLILAAIGAVYKMFQYFK